MDFEVMCILFVCALSSLDLQLCRLFVVVVQAVRINVPLPLDERIVTLRSMIGTMNCRCRCRLCYKGAPIFQLTFAPSLNR